ncbi:MAG: hypothetical protein GC159_07040 [Phycisphaera sp.]|nr:hypothetical protein [Phycisphaera sp.]
MNEAERQQVDLYLDGELSDAESEALLTRLEDDSDAVAYLAERSLLHNDLRRSMKRRRLQQWAVATTADEDNPHTRNVAPRTHRLSRTPLAAAVIGLVFGFIATSLVWGVIIPRRGVHVQSVIVESFEDAGMRLAPRFPDVSGVWNGTQGEIVHVDDAAEGRQVLRFGPAEDRRFSYVNRIVDVSRLAQPQDHERRELRLTVAVRPAEDAPSARRYKLRLAAFSEDPAAVKDAWFSGGGISEKALSFASRVRDVTQRGWVTLEIRLPLPPEARNAVISIGATAAEGGTAAIAYEVDDMVLELVTMPADTP